VVLSFIALPEHTEEGWITGHEATNGDTLAASENKNLDGFAVGLKVPLQVIGK